MAEKIKVGVVSLGCPKNQCDAEMMLAKIEKAGYKIVPEAGLADVVVINTCGFIQSAKEEAIEEIIEAINRKNDGINKKIIVTGCLAQRYQQQMDEEFPEVDGVLGLGKNQDIIETIERVLKHERVIDFGNIEDHKLDGDRMQSTLPHYAYLRIADG
ncbi:MAG: 30S ribosomal protein S12 methylthiotransferase RimO, partial [Ruminiclostridium sp.]|nr:30S ribosomal protein S12 methylthiotransferase RimO [Ruminiclostridium sp.]